MNPEAHKFFVIVDDNGNPIYSDHPEGPLGYLIMSQTQNLLIENFGEPVSSGGQLC